MKLFRIDKAKKIEKLEKKLEKKFTELRDMQSGKISRFGDTLVEEDIMYIKQDLARLKKEIENEK